MRGLRTKLVKLRCALACLSEKFDIIILVETWLNDTISDSELGFEGFNIFRCDRNPANSSNSRGGGILIAVRSCFFSRVLNVTVKY